MVRNVEEIAVFRVSTPDAEMTDELKNTYIVCGEEQVIQCEGIGGYVTIIGRHFTNNDIQNMAENGFRFTGCYSSGKYVISLFAGAYKNYQEE